MGSSLHNFYMARAADSRRAADAAALANVRERHLLSEHSWIDLAERADRVDTMRIRITAEKRAERAALAELAACAGD